MEITGSVALVTGANRGLGRQIVDRLLADGAAKVYAAARDASSIEAREGVVPLRIDVTDPSSIAAAAAIATDVTILVNNAGVSNPAAIVAGDIVDLRADFEVNTFGLIAVTRAFAPIIEGNGGGAITNVLSALSWFAAASLGGYSASKAASWSITNATRQELAPRGVHVAGVHVGWMDTDMASHVDGAKADPADVAAQLVQGIAADEWEIIADDTARGAKAGLSSHPSLMYPGVVVSG